MLNGVQGADLCDPETRNPRGVQYIDNRYIGTFDNDIKVVFENINIDQMIDKEFYERGF